MDLFCKCKPYGLSLDITILLNIKLYHEINSCAMLQENIGRPYIS